MQAEPLRFMGHARDRHRPGPFAGNGGLHLLFPATDMAVRRALSTAVSAAEAMGVGPDASGLVELVLAEVMNNVVEHAFADRGHGIIELEAWRTGQALSVRIRDDGVPMPDGEAPPARHHDLTVVYEDLPEGGFGWGIIRDLTRDLRYRRDGARNELTFSIDLDISIDAG
ncbi:ATP-binding protein [Maritimibacter sp. UBA3975]|uniref:ATP-binding protein n=1 Tax=Maritimibacter sp. UBA3975 TaxID=1946833 RepID=UPI000C0AAD7F|nr:ATP-binding protein [Maritimibacter sp. UBA3975]MAM62484.1 serine/threonine protein kinase [Maritimibacter sp.]|tara:strand:+ start:21205 stop:21714 length:510 start_codon:yes stop_codon:yes gene_type:complete